MNARTMSQARIFTPPNRLAKILGGLEGRCFDDLVTASENRLGKLEGAIRGYVADQLERLLSIHAQGEVAIFSRSRELGETAMNIAEVAGAARLEATSEVARGLRAMIDSLVTVGVWHTEALSLHISSLALLNRGDPPPVGQTQAMLQELKALRAAIGVVE